ncbi:MAG: hypothetical protein KKF48_02105 [Nanoarchaeota archaeon]|nr:hypothetical protein [Nanoarchaeota archaeon]MBU1027813.1 hypothetical protein [Nanoarchaeota archaeon]
MTNLKNLVVGVILLTLAGCTTPSPKLTDLEGYACSPEVRKRIINLSARYCGGGTQTKIKKTEKTSTEKILEIYTPICVKKIAVAMDKNPPYKTITLDEVKNYESFLNKK